MRDEWPTKITASADLKLIRFPETSKRNRPEHNALSTPAHAPASHGPWSIRPWGLALASPLFSPVTAFRRRFGDAAVAALRTGGGDAVFAFEMAGTCLGCCTPVADERHPQAALILDEIKVCSGSYRRYLYQAGWRS